MAALLSASAGLRIQPSLPCYRNIEVGKNPVLGPVSKAYPRSLKNPGPSGICIECSSRPKKKATAHHAKTRPKKHQPYDKNRKGPTKYEPFIFPPYPAPYLAMALKGPKPKKKPSFSDLISQMQQSLQTPVPAAGSAAQVEAEASAVVSTTTEDASVLAENSSAT